MITFSKSRLISLLTAGLLTSISVQATETQPTGLAAAVEQAWRLAPQAAALDARESEARASLDIASGLTPEPGSISLGNVNDRFNRNQGKQEYEIELAVPLWLPGQKAARMAEASMRFEEALAKRTALRLNVSGELREAWWAVAAARNAQALASRRLETARALEADILRRHKVGDVSRIDANLAQAETHAAKAEWVDAQTALIQAEHTIRTLTGSPAPNHLDEELLPLSLNTEAGAPGTTHPLLAVATAAARSAHARTQVADASRRASPELALRVVRERGGFDKPYEHRVGVQLKIPLSSDSQVLRERAEALAETNQADAELLRVQRSIQLDAERAQHKLQAVNQLLTLAQERRKLSAENLRLTEKAFALGETNLSALLRTRAAAFDAEALFDQQRVARAAAVSRLRQAMGVMP